MFRYILPFNPHCQISDFNLLQALLEYDSDECGPLEDPEDDPTLQVSCWLFMRLCNTMQLSKLPGAFAGQPRARQ